jgi:hypothetical protein
MSDTEHLALQDLLPWYASGALGEEEADHVQQHLRDCAACREDLAWQRKLLETAGPLPAGLDPERALARLMPQLDPALATASPPAAAPPRAATPPPGQRLRAWLAGAGWRNWALGAQFAALAILATLQFLPRAASPSYQALGRGAAATPDLLVVFKPAARLQEVQRILQQHSAQIIGGPTVTGAYMLEVDPSHQSQLLSALRADPAVELAESLTAGDPP